MKKKTQLLLACIAVLGIGLIIINACSKTENEGVTQKGVITHFSPSQDMVVPTITKFIQRFDNFKAGYKTGGEDIKFGEAIWTLEAGVNYEFQCPKEDLCDFTTASLTTTVDVYVGENNEYYITEENAVDLYDEMLSFTDEQVASEDVELLVTDLEVTSVENGQAEMKVTTTAGKGGINPYVINSTDYWYPVGDLGKCNGYTYNGKDASDRIREILNSSQVLATYWTDIDTLNLIYEVSCPCEYDQCFWEGASDDCLDPSEMQSWLNKASCVVSEIIPSGYSRIYTDFDWDVYVSGVLYAHYFHCIRYGIPHYSGGTK